LDSGLPTNNAELTAPRPSLGSQVAIVWQYATTHSCRETFHYLKSKEAPFVIQFIKYGVCGFIAFVTHNGIALWLSRTVFPSMAGLPAVAALTQAQMARNQIYANLVALAVSNLVAYLTNILWVFTGGRHHRVLEFIMFTAVNVISGAAGILSGPYLREHLGTSWLIAQATLIVTSALVNFACRKFYVFQR
jgi:putative flippase GtrA